MLDYHSIIIILGVLLAFSVTHVMVRAGHLSLVTHRKIWNISLAIFAFTSALLGLILAISIDVKMALSWYRTALWIHVEFGIAMAIVAMMHFGWHARYYLQMISKRNKTSL
jgi:hypothetical protein